MNHTEHYHLSQFEKSDRIQMEDFNADNAVIDAALKANADAIGTKANSATVGALTTRVGALERGKADQSTVETAISNEAATREAAISSEAATREAALTAMQSAMETAISGEAATREAALTAMQSAMEAAVGTHGHTCRITTGSYIGNGEQGKGNPISLTFGFYPVYVLIACSSSNNVSKLIRPLDSASSIVGGTMLVTWNDSGVSWCYTSISGDGSQQNNYNGREYFYYAIGYDL